MTDTDMLHMAALEKRCEELETRIAELEDKHWNECRQIARYDDELRKAKELLKAVVEDMSEKNFCAKVCKRDNFACRVSDTCNFKWRYEAEALALIGEDTNLPAREDDENKQCKEGV